VTQRRDVDELIAALDDDPDPLHADMTPAVGALGEIGDAAVPALLEPLASESETTRLHAQRALEAIVQRRHGFRAGLGWPEPGGEEAAREELRAVGYRFDADADARAAALDRLRSRSQSQ
jgi:hypothetical protein